MLKRAGSKNHEDGVFEQAILPHLDAAYNLARWIVRNDQDAEDVVQEACLRAYRFFGGFRGENSRAWLLTIVRNTCYTWQQQNRMEKMTTAYDEELHARDSDVPSPEALVLAHADAEMITRALEEIPVEFREAIILRELEGLSYKEISDVVGVPMGTVMSRLARARKLLHQKLSGKTGKGN